MFWSFGSVKGGVGTSVLVAAVASTLAQKRSVLVVDMADDQADLLGIAAEGPGLRDWLTADESVDFSSLDRLSITVGDNLELLPSGSWNGESDVQAGRLVDLVESLAATREMIVADLGVLGPEPFSNSRVAWAASARTTLVLRACYLGLSRARRIQLEPDDLVEVVEGGRALRTVDIEAVLGQPIDARLPVDPAIARAADAGFLAARPPRALRRVSQDLAAELAK